jgi:hypothetical protein
MTPNPPLWLSLVEVVEFVMVHHKSLEEVISGTSTILIVRVLRVDEPATHGFFLKQEFFVGCERVLLGKIRKNWFPCVYEQGMPHRRGQMQVSPLVSGSGLETTLKKGDRAVFLFASDGTLLRAEPLESVNQIMARLKPRRNVRRR